VKNEPDDSSKQLAERVGATSSLCEVVSTTPLSTSLYELVLSGNATTLAGVPGNDVMIRLLDAQGRFVRRRYSVRALDELNDTFTLWITIDHDGPGSIWVKNVARGELVDVIGPRGKVLLDPLADWHLFVGDASGLAAFYRMAQSIDVPGMAIFIVEIDAADDALSAPFDEGLGVTGIFVDRQGRSTSDPEGLLRGLESALLDRGLRPEQVSHKAFWRSGRSNADHGEPIKSDA
jgi:NADPH-dependent ferric siderophore reductase